MPELTIAARVARVLIEFAASRGADRAALAERSGITPAELEDADNRVPFAKYVALMRAGKELCRDPALALHFGESVDLMEISFACLIGAPSGTWAEGFAEMNRFARLAVEVETEGGGDRFQIKRCGGQLWMVDTRTNPNDFPELTDDAWLALTTPVFPPYVSEVLRAHAEGLLEKLERSKTTRGRVESLLAPVLHTGEASVGMVAGQMGLSRQTLFRRLKAEGVTFEKVLDELRRELALRHLSGKKASVNETAYLLGFSDRAAFSRAFKRWTGRSPRAVRATKADNDAVC